MIFPRVATFLLLYNILEALCNFVQAADGRTHAFVHVDGDLRYLIDNVQMEMEEFYRDDAAIRTAISFTDINEEHLDAYASPIAFHPPMLNFNFHHVGMPRKESVIVQNLSPDTSIHMLSISGNTLHTHCSFFQEKIIPPGSNTSFDVVLLAREEGPLEDTLFIHTSLGSFKFQISAIGIPNPYRLRPFVGVRMPLNSSFAPTIYMHNPFSTTLLLTEVYTSGGDLHLELPDDENEAPKSFWEIPPYETKAIIKANFVARTEKNHTAFIRFKTNCTGQDYLLLPIEVDVTSASGLYSQTEMLDFGLLRSHDEPKTLKLSLLNSCQKPIHIANVLATPVNEAIDIKIMPEKVAANTVFPTQIATITFDPKKALHAKQCCGKILIKSKNNQYKLHIPYQVQLINGSLDYNKNCTKFFVGHLNSTQAREFNVTNNYNVYIIIYNISFPDEAREHFIQAQMPKSVILKPGDNATITILYFKPTSPDLHLTSYFRVHTNISHVDIPILCFTGKLRLYLPHSVGESHIDFGTLGMGDKRTAIFAVVNENPIDVNLKFWGSNASKTYLELVGVDKGNASTLAWRQNFTAMDRSLILKPNHYVIFRIGITAPNYEGLFQSKAFVETQYQKLYIPFTMRSSKGVLKVDEIFFENSFPGKISTKTIYVRSTFSHSMTITRISTVPEDSRFSFELLKHGCPVLHPNSKNMVGKIHFDHRKYCKQKCYSGLPTTTTLGQHWLQGMPLPSNTGDVDRELFGTLYKRFQNLVELEGLNTNISLKLDTTEVKGYLLKAHLSLDWPHLIRTQKLKFPITRIGNYSVKDFTLENPSSLPIIVQVVPMSLYPNPKDLMVMLPQGFSREEKLFSEPDIFQLDDLQENSITSENHVLAYRKSLEEYFSIEAHKQSIAMLLTPGMRVRIPIRFVPKDDRLISSLIIIRNNLTVIESLLVQGRGGYGQIKFGNISPGSDSLLTFELTETHLRDCNNKKGAKYTVPNFTVRRTFTARNTGALPMHIRGFDINGKLCQGYGFRVLNCQPFGLKPNATKKIDIAFTPDFTLTRVERTLNIRTAQAEGGNPAHALHFKLVATIPRHMLSICAAALPRPPWEPWVFYLCLVVSALLPISEMVYAYLESNRILHKSFFPFMTMDVPPDKVITESVFDLKAISAMTVENNNSLIKQQSDVKKKREGSVESNGHILKTNCIHTKRKEATPSKEPEETTPENISNRNLKRRNPKPKISQETYSLEPELVEIKKSQPRNSWTRFLKPPFSFQTGSKTKDSNYKESVATQTTPDPVDDNPLKIDLLKDQNMNCFVESEEMVKSRSKSESSYDSKCMRKGNDLAPEEETSSTTTETSTTESDISEKDNRLPDVCVTSRNIKSKHTKSKTRDSSTNCNSCTISKSPVESSTDGDFEFRVTKNSKKAKSYTGKSFLTDVSSTSSHLELEPYRPKLMKKDKESESSRSRNREKRTTSPLNSTLACAESNSLVQATQLPIPIASRLFKPASSPKKTWATGSEDYTPPPHRIGTEDSLCGSRLRRWMSNSDQPLSYRDAAQMFKEESNRLLAPGSQRRWNVTCQETVSPPEPLSPSSPPISPMILDPNWSSGSGGGNSQFSLHQALETERELRMQFMKKKLTAPCTSDWPGINDVKIEAKYSIHSYFDEHYKPPVSGTWGNSLPSDPETTTISSQIENNIWSITEDEDMILNNSSHFH